MRWFGSTTQDKPDRPLPPRVVSALRRLLPSRVYYRYIGLHEEGSLSQWRHLVAGLPPSACVLDIGAHHGMYAVAARELRSDLAIFAFEPNPSELDELERATQGSDISIVPVAVAADDGAVTFSLNGESSRIIGDDETTSHPVATVPTVALDTWHVDADLDISLVKVDVEGHEAAVFRGGRRLMEHHRPIVLCEILRNSAGEAAAASLPERYLFFEIDEDRGLRQGPIPTRKRFRHKNWLLVPEERRQEIREGV